MAIELTEADLTPEAWAKERQMATVRRYLRDASPDEVARLFDEPALRKKIQHARRVSPNVRVEAQRKRLFLEVLLPRILGGISMALLLNMIEKDQSCRQAWAVCAATRRRDIRRRVEALMSDGRCSDAEIELIRKNLFARCWGRSHQRAPKRGA